MLAKAIFVVLQWVCKNKGGRNMSDEKQEMPLTKEDLVKFKKDLYKKLTKDKRQNALLSVAIMGWSATVGAFIALPETVVPVSWKWFIFGFGLLVTMIAWIWWQELKERD